MSTRSLVPSTKDASPAYFPECSPHSLTLVSNATPSSTSLTSWRNRKTRKSSSRSSIALTLTYINRDHNDRPRLQKAKNRIWKIPAKVRRLPKPGVMDLPNPQIAPLADGEVVADVVVAADSRIRTLLLTAQLPTHPPKQRRLSAMLSKSFSPENRYPSTVTTRLRSSRRYT